MLVIIFLRRLFGMNKKVALCAVVFALVLFLGGVLLGTALSDKKSANEGTDKSASGEDTVSAREKIAQNIKEAKDGKDIADLAENEKRSGKKTTVSNAKLSEAGDGYEGTKGTGAFNYGEALQKSLLFYELQRSGKLSGEERCNWRGDSALTDGADVGVDLTGGLYDAGDHVKFNLPMAYTGAVLGWSYYEDPKAYEESGQDIYLLSNLRWINDYLMKCHTEDEVYYYQVGDAGADHGWWGPCEIMTMDRPSFCVTREHPGSAVTAEAAASLAVASIVFKDSDPDYADLCLKHAKTLYRFADETRSDEGYTAANGFYNSWSGFYDELAWAGAWLYLSTDDDAYLTNAEECYLKAGQDYNWAMCWDDVHIGAALLLARITEDEAYTAALEKHLDWWTTGTSEGQRIPYSPKGLAFLDAWGSLRYATTTGFVAAVYSDWEGCPEDKSKTYWEFAVSQADYALGSTGFSYMVGFGEDYPKHPHHRTAQGSLTNNMNEPAEHMHTLYGALVGGPDGSDSYTDEVNNYQCNEVACDYNAGFTGLLAKMYGTYKGQTLINFGAVESGAAPAGEEGKAFDADGADRKAGKEKEKQSVTESKGQGADRQSKDGDGYRVSIVYDNPASEASAISGSLRIENRTGQEIDLKDSAVLYYFTKESSAVSDLVFECYYSAIEGGEYRSLSGVKGSFSDAQGTEADTACTIAFSEGTLKKAETVTINFSIHKQDWSAFDTSNDHSRREADHIVLLQDGKRVFGQEP